MPLLQVTDLRKHYSSGGRQLRAVDGVSFSVRRGETVGLVGESGCGKSSLGKTLLRLVEPTGGSILYDGREVTQLAAAEMKALRRRMQIIFQDPFASLNPRHSVLDILSDPLKVHGIKSRAERHKRVAEVIDWVGLPQGALERWPHEFSGGQRQRIGIARALVLAPEFIVCDEPVSALDLSIQAQILNLLVRMKHELGLSYLFVSHDLSVVRYFADRVLVMYLGQIVESGGCADVWSRGAHPYTLGLMQSLPDPARRKPKVADFGEVPSAADIPSGCRFHPRCLYATELCRTQAPPNKQVSDGHFAACHYAGEIGANAPRQSAAAERLPARPQA